MHELLKDRNIHSSTEVSFFCGPHIRGNMLPNLLAHWIFFLGFTLYTSCVHG